MDYMSYLVHVLLLFTNNAVGDDCLWNTTSCPTTKTDWMERKEQFRKCTSDTRHYTCMMTKNGTLAEACIISYKILPSKTGCPNIIACNDEVGPIIGLPSSFLDCPFNETGCPPTDHEGYTVYEMYEYPACIVTDREILRVPDSTEISTTTDNEVGSSKNKTEIALGVITLPLVVILIVSMALYIFCRKRKQRDLHKGNMHGMEERLLLTASERQGEDIHKAVIAGNLQAVKHILDAGVDINKKDEFGWTPLHLAAEGGHVDFVSVVLDHGADVNAKGRDGGTPFHRAARKRHVDVVSVLLDHGADVNAKDNEGDTPLHLAAAIGYVDVVSVLLDHSADVIARDKGENTPLHQAAGGGQVDIVAILLDHGADVNVENKGGGTPLHQAALKGHVDVVSVLLDHGADVNVKDGNGDNPLQRAVFYPIVGDTPRIPDFLIETGPIKILNPEQRQRFQDAAKQVIKEFDDIPKEVIAMGKTKVSHYRQNLRKGSIPCYHIRCMVVGHFGVGKTTMVKALLNKRDDKIESTDGIDVYRGLCFVNRNSKEWKVLEKHSDEFIGLDDNIQVEFWDFAGQALYHTTHPTYMSYRCLYLLTINLELGLQSEVDDVHLDAEKREKSKVIDFIHYWIGSIIHYSGCKDKHFPRIVVIGTHRDCCQDDGKLGKLVAEIKKTFRPLVESQQLIVEMDHFIDVLHPKKEDLDTIKEMIIRQGSSYPTYGERIPEGCIRLQKELKRWRNEQNTIVLPVATLQAFLRRPPSNHGTSGSYGINVDRGLTIENIYLYLEFYHSIGHIVFMNKYLLRDKIILDPRCLIEAMRCLITRRKQRDTSTHIYSKMGELKKSEVEKLWSESKKEFHEHSDHLLLTMEKLDLICLPKVYDEQGNDKTVDFYFVPSMVEESGPECAKPIEYREKRVEFDFKENLLPNAVFYRLICHCLTLWTVQGDSLFCDQSTLIIDQEHLLNLNKKGNKIKASLFHRFCIDSTVAESITLCIRETLDRILESYTSARILGLQTEWYDILDENGKPWIASQIENTEKSNSVPDVNEWSDKGTIEFDDAIELSEKQLMLIAWSVDKKLQYNIQKRIQDDLPVQRKETYGYIQLESEEKVLLLLRELMTYNNDKGVKTTAASLCKYVGKSRLHKALHHQNKEDTILPDLKKSLSHQMLDSVALMGRNKVFPVGIGLGLTINEIYEKVKDHENDTIGLSRGLLRYWAETRNKEATVETLARILRQTECNIKPLLAREL